MHQKAFKLFAAVMLARVALLPTSANASPKEAMQQEMNMQDPKSVLGRLGETVFVKKDFDRLSELMREDYIQHNPLVGEGRQGFRKFFEAWFKASPDFNYELKKIVSDGDMVWAYGSYSGTHSGEWLGVPATGKFYKFDAVDIFRVDGGKLAEHWDVIDVYGLFKQLGQLQ